MVHSTQLHGQTSWREQEYLTGWQRALAELDNFRKRMHQDQLRRKQLLRREVVESLLAVADNFHSLVQHMPKEHSRDSWAQGVGHIARQFEQALQDFGVTRIEPKGQHYDPTVHEVVEQIEKKGTASGKIVEVLQPGYRIGDAVIRPARVKVTA